MNRRNVFILILLITLLPSACRSAKPQDVGQTLPKKTPTATPTPVPPTPEVARTPVPTDVDTPIVLGRSPRLGENLPLEGGVQLVFDRAMDQDAVTGAFSLQQAGTSANIKGAFTWLDDATLQFQPAQPLRRGVMYDVILTQAAADPQDNPLRDPYLFRFETFGYLKVNQVIPAPGAADLETKPKITVIFDRPVVPLTSLSEMEKLPHPLTFEPDIEGEGEWLNTSTYVFNPTQDLEKGKTYTAIIATGLEDSQGAILAEDFIWQFSIKAPDPLRVRQTQPRDGQEQVGIKTNIVVKFDHHIDPNTAIDNFSLKAGRFFKSEVGGEFEIKETWLIFTPADPLDFDTTYTAQVSANVTSKDGSVQIAEDFSWTFNTVPLPKIISVTPKNGEREADPYSNLQVKFSAPISRATVLPNLEFSQTNSHARIR